MTVLVVAPKHEAKIVANSILVLPQFNGGSIYCVETGCESHDAYTLLPAAIEFDGRIWAKTSWNSDTGRACYKKNTYFGKALDLGS